MEYKEIIKLKNMLDKDDLPYTFEKMQDGYRLQYIEKNECICSVIEHQGSCGSDADLLEIMGLLTKKEEKYNTVKGCMTAEDVFKRIKKYHKRVMMINQKELKKSIRAKNKYKKALIKIADILFSHNEKETQKLSDLDFCNEIYSDYEAICRILLENKIIKIKNGIYFFETKE